MITECGQDSPEGLLTNATPLTLSLGLRRSLRDG